MGTSFLYGKYLISLFKVFYNINKLCFQKITGVSEDSEKILSEMKSFLLNVQRY